MGHLWRNSPGAIGFRYDPQWITQGGFAISHTLPLDNGDFTPEESVAHRFFANLVARRGHVYIWPAKERPRLSLAGAIAEIKATMLRTYRGLYP